MLYRPARINLLWLVLFSLFFVIAGGFVFFQLIESTIGGPSDLKRLLPVRRPPLRVAILKSDYTAQVHNILQFNGSGLRWRDTTVAQWQHLLQIRNQGAYPLTDENIEDGQLMDKEGNPRWEMLILPSVRALSDNEAAQIRRFMNNGGTVVATWALGLYKPDGSWRGWGFMEDLFGINISGFVAPGAASHRVTQEMISGRTKPGLYLKSVDAIIFPNAQSTSLKELDGYKWVSSQLPDGLAKDYVVADTFTSVQVNNKGKRTRIPSVSVTRYEWAGGNPAKPRILPGSEKGFRNFTVRPETPVTHGIPAGYRIRVGTYDRPIMFRSVRKQTTIAGYWYDHQLEDRPARVAIEESAGMVIGTYGSGRFVYIGHELAAMGGKDKQLGFDPRDAKVLEYLFNNIIDWLTRKPVAWASVWPFGYEAAASVMTIADDSPLKLSYMQDVLAGENVRGTYFLDANDLRMPKDFLNNLHQMGDIGLWDNAENPRAIQALLGPKKSELETKTSKQPVWGVFFPHMPSLGNLSAVQEAGYRYTVSAASDRSLQPIGPEKPFAKLVQVYKSGRTGTETLLAGARGALGVESGLLSEAERIRMDGGLYPVLFRTSDLENNGFLSGVRGAIRTMQAKRFWFASGLRLATWMNARERVRTTIRQTSDERFVVQISNDSNLAIDSLALYIWLPRPYDADNQRITIRPETMRMENLIETMKGVKTELVAGKDFAIINEASTQLRLRIRHLKPNQYNVFQVDVTPRKIPRVKAWWRF
ncbi:MAG: hypothetical protein JNN12_05310 [Bacteroidetes Order II. Incertae sedis bacterium]|nr:hypothetical protein [Bacteroidetes Order II. bacterium]